MIILNSFSIIFPLLRCRTNSIKAPFFVPGLLVSFYKLRETRLVRNSPYLFWSDDNFLYYVHILRVKWSKVGLFFGCLT